MNTQKDRNTYSPQDDEDRDESRESAYERAVERADYLNDEIRDRQIEELWARKERGEL